VNVIEAYQCEFCLKIYKSKGGCRKHESRCFANPVMRSCRSCKYATKEQETIYVPPQGDQNYGDADYDIETIICRITEKYLHHPEKQGAYESNCAYYRQGERLF
jgi:hypothetical protein